MDPFGKVRLGRTGPIVTRLGLGTAPLGGWPEAVSDNDVVSTVRTCLDAGVRYLDTAPYYGYGQAEQRIGVALRDLSISDLVVSTKVGRVLRPGASPNPLYKGAPPLTAEFDFSYESTLRSLEESRSRLGLDHIDIAYIHDPDDDHHEEALRGAFRALRDLRAAGHLSAIGVGMGHSGPLARFAKEGDFDCFMVAGRYTLLDQSALDDLLPEALNVGASVVAGGVFNSGILANPIGSPYYDYERASEQVIARAKHLEEICRGYEVPLRAAALQFPLAHPAVAAIVVGARSAHEAQDNIDNLQVAIPTELWAQLRREGLISEDVPIPA